MKIETSTLSNPITKSLQIGVLLASLLSCAVVVANPVDSFRDYQTAYQRYQEGVKKGLSADQLQKLKEDVLAAKNQHNDNLGFANSLSMGNEGQPAQTEDKSTATPEMKNLALEAAKPIKKPSTLEEKLINILYQPDSYKNPDKALAKLESFLEKNPNNPHRLKLTLELAKGYERLKGDYKKSLAILQKMAGGGNSLAYLKLLPGSSKGGGNLSTLYANKARFNIKRIQNYLQLMAMSKKTEANRQTFGKTSKGFAATPWYNLVGIVSTGWNHFWAGRKFSSSVTDQNKFRDEAEFFAENSPFADRMTLLQAFDTVDPANDRTQTKVRLMWDNPDSWNARWKILDGARESIDCTYFIIEDQIFGKALLGKLLEKAREGVKIRLMMDARGTKNFKATFLGQDFLQELTAIPNAEVKVYNPMHKELLMVFSNIRNLISSSHHKIIVSDSYYSITGGRNISPSYFVHQDDDPHVYRDTDVIMEGEYIGGHMKRAFEIEFYSLKNFEVEREWMGNWKSRKDDLDLASRMMDQFLASGKIVENPKIAKKINTLYADELKKYPRLYMPNYQLFDHHNWSVAKILTKSGFLDTTNEITKNLIRFIDGCDSEVIIQNPYVILTKRMKGALMRASARGVKIFLHTNSPVSTDSLMTQAMFYGEWKETLRDVPTLRMFTFHKERKLHAKTFVFDQIVGVVGTYNMDPMSEQINGECVAAIWGEEFAKESHDVIMNRDIADSVEYKIHVHPNGEIEVLFGPDSHPGQGKKIKMIRLLSKLRFLREII